MLVVVLHIQTFHAKIFQPHDHAYILTNMVKRKKTGWKGKNIGGMLNTFNNFGLLIHKLTKLGRGG